MLFAVYGTTKGTREKTSNKLGAKRQISNKFHEAKNSNSK